MLPDRIPFTSNATVAWLPDETGFAVNAGTAPDFERVDKVLLVHRLGQAEPAAARADRGARAVLRLPAGLGRRALPRRDHERGRAARRLDPRAPERQLAALPARRRGHVQRRLRRRRLRGGLHGGGAAGASRQDPDRHRGRRETWVELIPEGDVVLRLVQRAGDLLVVSALREACSVVIVVAPRRRGAGARASRGGARLALGGPRRRPARGCERGHRSGGGRGRLLVRARRPRPLRRALPLRARDGHSRRAAAARGPLPVRRHALRGDRARRRAVGYEVVHRADLEPVGLPAVVYAYGGWNVALVRGSLGVNAQLVEAGVALRARPHPRRRRGGNGLPSGRGARAQAALLRRSLRRRGGRRRAWDRRPGAHRRARRLERRAHGRGGGDAAPRPLVRRLLARPRHRHAALPPEPVRRDGPARVRRPRRPGRCRRAARLLAVPQHPLRAGLPADPRRRGCERHALPGLARPQVRRPAPGGRCRAGRSCSA